jgi:hypothetical protein
MSFKRFDAEDLVVGAEPVSAPVWSTGTPILTTFFTSSTQPATTSGNFYYNIYQTGSTLASACLSPIPNFTFGIFALVTAFFMAIFFYLSHFHNTSFIRKERVVNLILINSSQLFRAASKL